jgi:hypothetical protein
LPHVEKLNTRTYGKISLWVGNNSEIVHGKKKCSDFVKVIILQDIILPGRIIVRNDYTNKADYFFVGDILSSDTDNIRTAFKQ